MLFSWCIPGDRDLGIYFAQGCPAGILPCRVPAGDLNELDSPLCEAELRSTPSAFGSKSKLRLLEELPDPLRSLWK